jgi:hypothetical protein
MFLLCRTVRRPVGRQEYSDYDVGISRERKRRRSSLACLRGLVRWQLSGTRAAEVDDMFQG